jgi:hypothetical protein
LFNFVSVVSLLLFVATVVVWVRSFWRADYLYFTKESIRMDGPIHRRHADWAYGLLLMDGTVQFDRRKDAPRDDGWSFEGLRSGESGPWDWGDVDIAGDAKDGVRAVGFTEPTDHWWLFG